HFAVKQLHLQSHEGYAREVELFERLGVGSKGKDLDHLIQLQLTYKHGQSYYLVFPWADGNLLQFWSESSATPGRLSEIVWLLGQCMGLVRALRKIHHVSDDPKSLLDNKYWGRHGDIKPENILWFKKYEESQRNFLVISDFGLTRFNSADSRSKVAHDSIKGFSGSYRPPEVDLKGTISQRYDIWSLGCVFLEFVSWFLIGHNRTKKDFTDARIREDSDHTGLLFVEDKFFNINPSIDGPLPTANVKRSVTSWIDDLHQQKNCAEPVHELLDLIQYTMLVPDSKERWVCSRIQPAIHKLILRSRSDAAYATKGTYGAPDPLRFPSQFLGSQAVRKRTRHLHLLTYMKCRRSKTQIHLALKRKTSKGIGLCLFRQKLLSVVWDASGPEPTATEKDHQSSPLSPPFNHLASLIPSPNQILSWLM
ncbi:serine/threonine protein kinase, partial [Colletotrichum orchidophilum]